MKLRRLEPGKLTSTRWWSTLVIADRHLDLSLTLAPFTQFVTLRLCLPQDKEEAQLSPFWQPRWWCYHCWWPPHLEVQDTKFLKRRDPYASQWLDEVCDCRRWLKIKLENIKCGWVFLPSAKNLSIIPLLFFYWPCSEAFDIKSDLILSFKDGIKQK